MAHLVAPTPQAKGKIERRFGTFQNRIVTLQAHAKVEIYEQADKILQMEIIRQNRTKQRNTNRIPLETWDQALLSRNGRLRPTPASSLLDLLFSMRGARRVNNDQTIDFEGRNYEISTTSRKSVAVVHHPNIKFSVVDHPPKDVWPTIVRAFSL